MNEGEVTVFRVKDNLTSSGVMGGGMRVRSMRSVSRKTNLIAGVMGG